MDLNGAAFVSIEMSRNVHPEHSEGKAGGKYAFVVTPRRPDNPSCTVQDPQNDKGSKAVAGECASLCLHFAPPNVRRPLCVRAPAIAMQGYTSLIIEMLEQLRSFGEEVPTHVFVQGGAGGLAAAVISYLWEELGPQRAPAFAQRQVDSSNVQRAGTIAPVVNPAMTSSGNWAPGTVSEAGHGRWGIENLLRLGTPTVNRGRGEAH